MEFLRIPSPLFLFSFTASPPNILHILFIYCCSEIYLLCKAGYLPLIRSFLWKAFFGSFWLISLMPWMCGLIFRTPRLWNLLWQHHVHESHMNLQYLPAPPWQDSLLQKCESGRATGLTQTAVPGERWAGGIALWRRPGQPQHLLLRPTAVHWGQLQKWVNRFCLFTQWMLIGTTSKPHFWEGWSYF